MQDVGLAAQICRSECSRTDGAGDMMLAATYAIRAGFTVDDLADTWAPYLTMAESLRLAAGLFSNQLPTSCCA